MLKSIGSGKQQNFYIINEKKPKQYSKKIRGYEIIVSDDSDNEDSRLLIKKNLITLNMLKESEMVLGIIEIMDLK